MGDSFPLEIESEHRRKAVASSKQRPPAKGIRQNYELNRFERCNDALFEFFKQQGIVPDSEWDHGVSLKEIALPITSSATSSNKLLLLKQMKRCPLKTKMARATIRRHPILKEFHQFLVNETELGNISRQEACSMVPPLLLDVQPHHRVLDACAAPGSKTMQIIELMHENCSNPEGLVVANDSDYKRCYLLVRQTLKRMPTANVVVVSHDASQLPTVLDAKKRPVLFDRILCDLICSGDGTLRKNPELWKSWDPLKGVNLHKLQLQIALRCLELLAVGGLMVYSTCSLNPIEDEAVIAQLLRKFNGLVELVDVSDQLPELKRASGMSKWKVFDKEMKEVHSLDDLRVDVKRYFKPSMFPPTPAEASQMHLERCFRILPHSQDSGGFFVALLRKTEVKRSADQQQFVEDTNAETTDREPISSNLKSGPPKRARLSNKEDPFIFLGKNDENNERFISELNTHFGISPDKFPHSNLLVRSHNTERKKEIYFVNDAVRDFLMFNEKRFRIVNAGVGVLKRIASEKVAHCPYRLKQDGLRVLSPFISKKIVDIPVCALVKILKGRPKEDGSSQFLPFGELGANEALFKDMATGSLLLRFRSESLGTKILCTWKGTNSISAFVSREEKIHILSLLDERRGGPRAIGSDGSDFKHRQKIAASIKLSIQCKFYLKMLFLLHLSILLPMWVKVGGELVFKEFGLLEQPDLWRQLDLPAAYPWEYVWCLSFIPMLFALLSFNRNKAILLKLHYYGQFVFGLMPACIGIGSQFPELVDFLRHGESSRTPTFKGHFPMVVLWYLFFIAIFQVHGFSMYFSYNLYGAWHRKPPKGAQLTENNGKDVKTDAMNPIYSSTASSSSSAARGALPKRVTNFPKIPSGIAVLWLITVPFGDGLKCLDCTGRNCMGNFCNGDYCLMSHYAPRWGTMVWGEPTVVKGCLSGRMIRRGLRSHCEAADEVGKDDLRVPPPHSAHHSAERRRVEAAIPQKALPGELRYGSGRLRRRITVFDGRKEKERAPGIHLPEWNLKKAADATITTRPPTFLAFSGQNEFPFSSI
uniref:tRNA (cytosine(34)-C(5))-methyltransferase n=1 Tax=Globodera rostochiensis TaxID=31243 RepID=A0A914I5Y6_GLORO